MELTVECAHEQRPRAVFIPATEGAILARDLVTFMPITDNGKLIKVNIGYSVECQQSLFQMPRRSFMVHC